MVDCPICGAKVREQNINGHIDSQCQSYVVTQEPTSDTQPDGSSNKSQAVSSFFQTPASKKSAASKNEPLKPLQSPIAIGNVARNQPSPSSTVVLKGDRDSGSTTDTATGNKRSFEEGKTIDKANRVEDGITADPPPKRSKTQNAFRRAAPLADRMRPRSLDEVCGQELVGPNGVLRGLIEQDRVPSMILWGAPGTGKTTIARLIAKTTGGRFVEINSTSSGVEECKRIFAEARSELSLNGKKTILFCDEIHRFSRAQQQTFLGPTESGQVCLVGATTENPSFKIHSALLSRARVFVLQKLGENDIRIILSRAMEHEGVDEATSVVIDAELIGYLAALCDGDARIALNLLELTLGLSSRPGMTKEAIKKSLTRHLLYDRSGDQHFDSISAFHKSIRGSDPDAALYYLARMIESGEDPLYIARRLIVIASEDIGLADNSMLPLAIAAHNAVEKIGLPEAQINLAHATVAMALGPKSTRVYRSLGNVAAALRKPGVAGLPVPVHLRNAPTRLMKEMGYGKEYKYNPNYKDGKVAQEYLPDAIRGSKFMEDRDLGTEVDPEYISH
ncbi:MAG: hypothetical protein M1816_006230 [Peltula sp. TS41687]|nr:MAG: hypothetical protein M1816_006230 [Peltula sp. TS41687]